MKNKKSSITKFQAIVAATSLFFFPGFLQSLEKNVKSQSFKDNIILSDQTEILPKALLDSPLIFIGENHTEFSNHTKQLEIIKGIHKSNKKIAIGMEMFSRKYQNVINDYLKGKINELEFLKNTDYFSEWGYDYKYYKNIVDFAKSNKIDLIGLNISNEIVHKIGRNGFREISSREFREIPEDIDFSIEDYKNILGEIFAMHSDYQNRQMDNFYFAQLLRDEFMAQSAFQYSLKNPDTTIIVLAGNGHIEKGYGIPVRLKRMTGKSYKAALLDYVYIPEAADYFIYTKPEQMKPTPRLQVMLADDHGKIKVTGFYDSSENKSNPLNVNDLILSLDKTSIKSIPDIRLFLYGKSEGDLIKINILRDNKPMTLDFMLPDSSKNSN